MTKQIFPSIFYFISFITLYSPLTFSLIPRANSNPMLPPYPLPPYSLPPPIPPPSPSTPFLRQYLNTLKIPPSKAWSPSS